jgi:hypothetical protein
MDHRHSSDRRWRILGPVAWPSGLAEPGQLNPFCRRLCALTMATTCLYYI